MKNYGNYSITRLYFCSRIHEQMNVTKQFNLLELFKCWILFPLIFSSIFVFIDTMKTEHSSISNIYCIYYVSEPIWDILRIFTIIVVIVLYLFIIKICLNYFSLGLYWEKNFYGYFLYPSINGLIAATVAVFLIE